MGDVQCVRICIVADRRHPGPAAVLHPACARPERARLTGLQSAAAEWLTSTELEALRWTMDGKSPREIGQAMAVSEEDVVLRLRTAMNKLGCSSKYETVLRAIRLGLIRCA
jgi:DNA-binding CsgD family transcriptional regulator